MLALDQVALFGQTLVRTGLERCALAVPELEPCVQSARVEAELIPLDETFGEEMLVHAARVTAAEDGAS